MDCENCKILESKVIGLEDAIRHSSRYLLGGSQENKEYRRKYYELLAEKKTLFQYIKSLFQ